MASTLLECPHCGAEKIGFSVIGQHFINGTPQHMLAYRTILSCAACEELVVAHLIKAGRTQPGSPQEASGDPLKHGFSLLRMYPVPAPTQCPEHTPDNLKRIFLQAANALRRGDSDASGAMSRKVIDVSTQTQLGEEAKKHSNIYARIEALAAKGKLTTDLKNWAHEVRLGGADAAHDLDPFTQEEAEELVNFAELYLIYVYSLPERLRLRREKAAAEKAAKHPT